MPQHPRPFSELRDTGLLWLVNAAVLHPRGYALALHFGEPAPADVDAAVRAIENTELGRGYRGSPSDLRTDLAAALTAAMRQCVGWSVQGDGEEPWSFGEECDAEFRDVAKLLEETRLAALADAAADREEQRYQATRPEQKLCEDPAVRTPHRPHGWSRYGSSERYVCPGLEEHRCANAESHPPHLWGTGTRQPPARLAACPGLWVEGDRRGCRCEGGCEGVAESGSLLCGTCRSDGCLAATPAPSHLMVAGEELRSAAGWELEFGIRIIDPDGWRSPRPPLEPCDLGVAITRGEFEIRAGQSTTAPINSPAAAVRGATVVDYVAATAAAIDPQPGLTGDSSADLDALAAWSDRQEQRARQLCGRDDPHPSHAVDGAPPLHPPLICPGVADPGTLACYRVVPHGAHDWRPAHAGTDARCPGVAYAGWCGGAGQHAAHVFDVSPGRAAHCVGRS